MGIPTAALLAVSTFGMLVYFSAGALYSLGRENALPGWLAALERAQTPVGPRMRPVAFAVGGGMCVLSQVTVLAVLLSLPLEGWPVEGAILLAELLAAALWGARIALRWDSGRPRGG